MKRGKFLKRALAGAAATAGAAVGAKASGAESATGSWHIVAEDGLPTVDGPYIVKLHVPDRRKRPDGIHRVFDRRDRPREVLEYRETVLPLPWKNGDRGELLDGLWKDAVAWMPAPQ